MQWAITRRLMPGARRGLAMGLLGAVLGLAGPASLPARAADQPSDRVNAGTVGIVSGGVEGTYVRIAADLAAVLDDGDRLRILPVLGKGSVQNLGDILHLRGIDIGIVQSDVLAYARRENLFPNLANRVRYVTKLYNEEFHVLARPEIAGIEDLAGRKVNMDVRSSGTAMTASLVFGALKIAVEPTNFDQSLALEKLRRGEIAALAYVAGKPARLFRDVRPEEGLHFLAIPPTPELLQDYLPSQLSHREYEGLIAPDAPVDTVAVGAVMAVYNWERNSERYRKVARFVEAFFSRFDEFLKPPRHPKWAEVNLAATVPGWTPFEPAVAWLRQASVAEADPAARDAFRNFAARRGIPGEQAEALFEQFLRWQARAQQ
ncbi:TAXI family TRAP transporter solute-binding subunit [Arenibaculum pallidiluteum]|uniref:TAXI family TRAP transporter solute-binding subunit n=1 Tax=Arenibaculum pallidiluteum TaxID=2812559 RepID=UPI001F31E483|nr:TAXI family TRAP transporter solute-binding subunit [Arenibaculum pallidiluteum]